MKKENEQNIDCSVYDCKYCDCEYEKCSLDSIKVCNCNDDCSKESTMCDSYKKDKEKADN